MEAVWRRCGGGVEAVWRWCGGRCGGRGRGRGSGLGRKCAVIVCAIHSTVHTCSSVGTSPSRMAEVPVAMAETIPEASDSMMM